MNIMGLWLFFSISFTAGAILGRNGGGSFSFPNGIQILFLDQLVGEPFVLDDSSQWGSFLLDTPRELSYSRRFGRSEVTFTFAAFFW
jgi:hypothetical protein